MTEFEGAQNRRDVPLRATVRDIIAELQPEELELVDSLDDLDDQELARQFARGDKGKVLGIGSVELDLITPVLWLALDEAARRFGEVSADGMVRGGWALIRKVFHRHTGPIRVPLLSQAQLAEVREAVLKSCKGRGRSLENRADEIADAVVRRLVLPPEQPPDPGAPGSGGDGGAQS